MAANTVSVPHVMARLAQIHALSERPHQSRRVPNAFPPVAGRGGHAVGDPRPHAARDASLRERRCAALHVFWGYEIDRRGSRSRGAGLGAPVGDRVRRPAPAPAFLHRLRCHRLTVADSHLCQAPFRTGIRPDAHQMEPQRKALRLLRMNLFIADDTRIHSYVSELNRGRRRWQGKPAASATAHGNRRQVRARDREAAIPRTATVREAVGRRASK